METKTRTLVTAAAIPTSIKVVLRRPPTATETPKQRSKRLKAQAAANHIRCTAADDRYIVTSQTQDAEGHRETYLVVANGASWVCACEWGQHQPGSSCAHIEQVRAHRRRKHQPADPVPSEKTVTDLLIARADAERQARGRLPYREEI